MTGPWQRWRPGIGTLAVVIAIVPLVVATVRALARGWVAVGDNGILLMRAQDVLTANHPLLGTWTSASLGAGRSINNPGPLWFDVLTPFVRVGGPSVGLAVAVMTANAACIVLAAWAARRAGGPKAGGDGAGGDRALLVVTALSAGLAWSMGSELLFDAWQPHAMILPFWAFLVMMWAVGTGDLLMAPFAVGLASLIAQTHLSFVYVLAVVGVAGTALAVWSLRQPSARHGGTTRPPLRRPLLASAAVFVVAWIQPVIDQVAGEGNLGALLAAGSSSDGETIGLRLGIRLVGSIVALPPWWGRSGFSGTIVATGVVNTGGGADVVEGDVAAGWPAAIGLLVVVGILAATIVVGRRRGTPSTVVLAALAAAAIAGSVVSTLVSPVNVIGLSPHQLRWLWPVSTFVLAAPVVALAGWASVQRAIRPVGLAAVAVLAALALPTHAAPEGPTREHEYGPTVGRLVDQLDEYRPDGPVVFDATVLRFAEPYSGPVLAALGRNGVDVVVADETTVRQLGEGRRADGTEQRRVFLLEGSAAEAPPDDARRVAFSDGLTVDERAELVERTDEVIGEVGVSGLVLNEAGLDAAAAGRLPFEQIVLQPGGDAAALAEAGWLTAVIENDWVDLPADRRDDWRRWADLDTRQARFTVGLFEAPL
ncbi:MAG: hypothetical protein ACR2HQ_05610 [Ilumatobacteraceae bacterium]